MYEVSDEVRRIIKSGKKAYIKVKCGNFVFGYDDESDPDNPVDLHNIMQISVRRASSHDDFPIGKSFACMAKVVLWDIPSNVLLKGQKTSIFMGYMVNGKVEWVPLGIYYPEKPQRSGQLLSFTAFDRMYDLSFPYAATISGQQTPLNVLRDMARQGGFELDETVSSMADSEWGTIPVSALYGTESDGKVTAYNVNDAIGFVAGFIGCNAHFNREGKLQLYRFVNAKNSDGTVYTITDDHADQITISEDDHRIQYINCVNGEKNLYSPSDVLKGTGVRFENPLFTTQEQIDRVFAVISDNEDVFAYRPGSLNQLNGDPTLDCFDVVQYTDNSGVSYRFPIIYLEIYYSGSVSCELQATAKSEQETYNSNSILNRVLTSVVQKETKSLIQRIENATEVITGVAGGYVALVDTDGDKVPDNLIAAEYPVDLKEGSDWRTKGNCIRINRNGIGVSTTGADGPFTDFAVYYDKSKGKYLLNASDISTGVLEGIKIIAEDGKIGGWIIDDDCIYSDYTASNGSIYRAFIQNASVADGDSWVFSTQKFLGYDENGNEKLEGSFIVKADGSVYATNGLYANSIVSEYFEGGNIIFNYKGSIYFQLNSQNRFIFRTVTMNSDLYDTISSTSHMLLEASGGSGEVWINSSIVYLRADLKLNFQAVSGTVPLVVNSSGIVTATSSSIRYKENITKTLPEELNPEKLYSIPVVAYNYKEEHKDKELVSGTQIGITAEDVSEIYPNACIYNKDGQPESWQDRIMIPAMLKLIQEQKNEISSLKKRVAEQEDRLKALENILEKEQS